MYIYTRTYICARTGNHNPNYNGNGNGHTFDGSFPPARPDMTQEPHYSVYNANGHANGFNGHVQGHLDEVPLPLQVG